VEPFDLEGHLGDGPVVLAFFPGAFTPPCSNEMVALQERHDEFVGAGATLLGVSADSVFSGNAFREEHGIEFDLVSDMAREAIGAYDLEIDIDELGLHGVANRAVYSSTRTARSPASGSRTTPRTNPTTRSCSRRSGRHGPERHPGTRRTTDGRADRPPLPGQRRRRTKTIRPGRPYRG